MEPPKLVKDVVYDSSNRVTINNDSYYGFQISSDKIKDSGVSDKVEEDVNIDEQPEVNLEHLRVGNLIKLALGSKSTSDYNKTVYRVKDFVLSEQRTKDKRRCTSVFLEPSNNRADSIRLTFSTIPEETRSWINSRCYSIAKGTSIERAKEAAQEYRPFGTNRDWTKRKLGGAKIVPDSALYKYYDIDIEDPVFSVIKL